MKTIDEALAHLQIPFNLAPLQLEDAEEYSKYNASGLFYDVGVGKTVVSTVITEMWDTEVRVIVMPPILLLQWEAWIREVDPTASVQIYHGPGRELLPDVKWLLTSYGIFRRDFEKIFHHVAKHTLAIIVDEAHALKNIDSKLYKKVKTLAAANKLLLLTGTATSKPTDAYSYISLKTPKVYRSYGHFENIHVGERDFFGNVKEWLELPLLRDNLHLQAVKRSKEEMFGDAVAPPLHQTLSYELSKQHKALYEEMVENMLLELDDGSKIDLTTAQRLYHGLGQVIVNLGYFCGDESQRSASFDLLDQVIDQTGCQEEDKTKLIIYSNYVRSNKRLLEYLGPTAVGAYSKANSARSVQQFMNDPSIRFLVGHYDSMGVGLNPQGICNVELFLEPSTVPLKMRQAAGRVDRMGQKRVPTLYYGCALGTVQVTLLNQLLRNDDLVAFIENKRNLRDMLLGNI